MAIARFILRRARPATIIVTVTLFALAEPSRSNPSTAKLDRIRRTSHQRAQTGTTSLASSNAGSVTITGQNAGPTPFISELDLSVINPTALQSVRFAVTPKPGSVTREVAATYFSDYLQSRGYFDVNSGTITLPVFGLYADYSNTVTLTCCFADGSSQTATAMVQTGPYIDTCGYNNPTVLQARTNDTTLTYDFILLKGNCSDQSPVVIDTDGAVRWVAPGAPCSSSIFSDNGFFTASIPPGSTHRTGLSRLELDGTVTFLKDYSDIGVTSSGHHNIDPGKYGLILEVDTTAQNESVIIEVDGSGNVLKRWDLADIISAAMVAGGDDPNQFVAPSPTDWFHNNAVAYRKSDDSLVVSSRENFVIDIDYQTGAIKWILGDPTKQWYQFPSLRAYALALSPGSLPPIGQHAVSITADDDLLLFDDGKSSLHHTPAGADRSYSAPRKYSIDPQAKVATEVWNFPNGQTLYSAFCSSVYEDDPLNYLVDYTQVCDVLALNPAGDLVFHYHYTPVGCGFAWNAIPVHFENLVFTGPLTGGLRVTAVERIGSNTVMRFPALAGNTYRVEYKNALTNDSWLILTDFSADCSCITQMIDATAAGQELRFYRVRLLTP